MGQIVLRLDESGDPTYRYLWGPAVDQLLADEYVDDGSAGDVYWPLADQQNTVRDLVVYDPRTEDADVVSHIIYDAYGNKLSETRATDCIFGYTGKLFDSATGLQNNLNRWYDPSVGRWLSEDPIGFEGGDANLYRYVANDPANGIDPSGLQEYGPSSALKQYEYIQEVLPEIKKREQERPPGSTLDDIQTALDVAGLTPGIGNLADAANTLISLGRGNWGEAGMNALAMVPIAGQGSKVAQLTAKAAKAVAKHADEAVAFSKLWGKNRLIKELYDKGYILQKSSRKGDGLIFINPKTGEQVRIMPKPNRKPYRGESPEKFKNDSYYRYKSGPHAPEGPHTTLPDSN